MDLRLANVNSVAIRIDRSSSKRNGDTTVLQASKVVGVDRRSRAVVENIYINGLRGVCRNLGNKSIVNRRSSFSSQIVSNGRSITVGSQLGTVGGLFVNTPFVSALNKNANSTLETFGVIAGIHLYRRHPEILE